MIKDKVCKLIKGSKGTLEEMRRVQDQTHVLNVRAVGQKGERAQIRFSERDEWIDPISWARNHETNLIRSLCELMQRLNDIDCDPNKIESNLEACHNEAGFKFLNDLRGFGTRKLMDPEVVSDVLALQEELDLQDDEKQALLRDKEQLEDDLKRMLKISRLFRGAILVEEPTRDVWLEKFGTLLKKRKYTKKELDEMLKSKESSDLLNALSEIEQQ